MLALYRCGRQNEALESLPAGPRAPADEVGLAPGPGLQELQARILQQDPSLETPVEIGRPWADVCFVRPATAVDDAHLPTPEFDADRTRARHRDRSCPN